MSSPEHRKLFPSFSKQKQSPIKSLTSKLQGTGLNSAKGGMKQFFESKVPKGIKLNNLNQVNSIHSSVYQFGNDQSGQESSLRNIVNSSYFNSTQQSIIHIYDQHTSKVSESQNVDSSPLRRNQVGGRESGNEVLQNSRGEKSGSIRSRSLSNLSNNHLKVMPITEKKPIFDLTQNNINPSINQINSALETFIEQKKVLKQKQMQVSQLPVEEQVQQLFTRHFGRGFIRSLIEYMNKDWARQAGGLLEDRRVQMLLNIMSSKFASLEQIIADFLCTEFQIDYNTPVETTANYTLRETKLVSSILLKQCSRTFEQMKRLFEELVSKLPQEGIIEQEFQLDELKKSVLQIYDPKFTYSSEKMKERFKLYYEAYCMKRNSLQTEIKHKLKPQLTFIKQIESYLSSYQQQLIKLKSQISNLETEKQHLMELLKEKTTFRPIQMDFKKFAKLKEEASEKIKNDFEENIVKFHTQHHEKNTATIEELTAENKRLKNEVTEKQRQKQYHQDKLEEYLRNIPTKKDQSTQIFNIPLSNTQQNSLSPVFQTSSSADQSPIYFNFLQNIVTPFTFNQKITSSLISIITIDKMLYDYEPIKMKLALTPFRHYVYEWFIIRTGSKRIAQILLKNFLYSIKKYRNKHKRFNIFNRICGHTPVRGKNLQEDIEHLFYQSNLAWYYLVKLALIYRKKLNDTPTGYHIFPPMNCEQIFKLPLRKSYEVIEEFFVQEEIAVPENLSQKIDHYAINEISKFKQNDEQFQKQSLQEIHILREFNFDVIAGFIIDYVASQKAVTLESLFRSIHLKQQEEKTPIGYGEFQTIYKKYFKQKRSKIELVYSKFCLCSMLNVLNAQNMTPVIRLCIEDQAPLRSVFEKHQSLRALVMTEKQTITINAKLDKKNPPNLNPNSFDNFKERFYQQFYDFYDMTIILEEVFKIVKVLIKKKLKKIDKEKSYIDSLLEIPKGEIVGEKKEEVKPQKSEDDDQEEEDSSDEDQSQKLSTDKGSLQKLVGDRTFLEQKLDEWRKIQERIPHFATKILTIEQIIIHNMRKKEMLEGCEFAWRTLREVLVFISK